MTTRPAAAILTVTPVNPPGTPTQLLMGEEPPRIPISQQWDVLDRPRRTGAVEWKGTPPLSLTIDAALSYADVGRSVEELFVQFVQRVATPKPPRNEPPVVRVTGPGIPPIGQFANWVVTSIEPGDEERNLDGTRNLMFFTIEFLEYRPPTLIISGQESQAKAAAARAKSVSPTTVQKVGDTARPSSKTYIVKEGDTLSAIAARQLGNSNRWTEIANLNGIRDPKRLSIGTSLRLP